MSKKLIFKEESTIIHVTLMSWRDRYKQRISCKKYISKELKPAAWHATRWWDWCLAEDEKKRVEAIINYGSVDCGSRKPEGISQRVISY